MLMEIAPFMHIHFPFILKIVTCSVLRRVRRAITMTTIEGKDSFPLPFALKHLDDWLPHLTTLFFQAQEDGLFWQFTVFLSLLLISEELRQE